MTTPKGATAPESGFVLPVTNQQVTLRGAHGHEYAAWVLEVGIRAITLTRSAPSLDEPIPEPGDEMELSWPIEQGEQILAVAFAGNQRPDSDLLWDVRPTGQAWRRQRRNYPRVLTFSPAHLTLPRGETHDCMLLDANEVALRVHVAAEVAVRLDEKDQLRVGFDLGGQKFALEASVFRITPAEDGSVDIVVNLIEDDETRGLLRGAVADELAHQEKNAPWID